MSYECEILYLEYFISVVKNYREFKIYKDNTFYNNPLNKLKLFYD